MREITVNKQTKQRKMFMYDSYEAQNVQIEQRSMYVLRPKTGLNSEDVQVFILELEQLTSQTEFIQPSRCISK